MKALLTVSAEGLEQLRMSKILRFVKLRKILKPIFSTNTRHQKLF